MCYNIKSVLGLHTIAITINNLTKGDILFMKKILCLMVGITMSLCLFTGCENKQKYELGTISDGIYKNKSLLLNRQLLPQTF